MYRRNRTLCAVIALTGLAACSEQASIPTAAPVGAAMHNNANNGIGIALQHQKVCPGGGPGEARCHAWIRVDDTGNPFATGGPSGYNPADLVAAYQVPAGGAGVTIAIVDAFDDPNAESDLAVYRARFGLPACTTANGCFRKVDQNGGTRYPRADKGWAEEISLDLDMASAICPACRILLVEATSNSFANLSAAVDRAAALGATVISNSYGGGEFSGETSQESHFNKPGVTITASSGDAGYGVEFPAASQYVVAVGGTHLTFNGSSWNETVWSGAGSGCSAYVSKPSWQADAGCSRRTVADVAAVADPNTGVSVYDSFRVPGGGGWLVFGGTSVSAPIIGAMYAVKGGGDNASSLYAHPASLFDVIVGSNGNCGGSYLCTASAGFDGPTGLGAPRGTIAF